jgi:hypothetical protein
MITWQSYFQLLIVVSILALVSSAHGNASIHPFWTEQAMFRFGDEMFFAGRASCAPSVEEGRQRAYEAAIQEIRNFTRSNDIAGIMIETQMVYEATESPDCASTKVNVWRLLRVQTADVERLARRAGSANSLSHPSSLAQTVPDRTLQVGMSHDEIWERVGQPRSISILPQSHQAVWEFPQFGLTLVLDEEERLKSWKLIGHRLTSPDSMPPVSHPPTHTTQIKEAPVIDLTDRLRVLEEETHAEHLREALHICATRFPKDLKQFDDLRGTCERHAYERFGIGSTSP